MKYFITIILVFCVTKSFTQRETENWYFGDKAGLNFTNGIRTVLNNSEMSTPKGSASISDKNGNLLFYTNGETVWNKNHEIMTNSNFLSGNKNSSQPVIIIPKPLSETEYYIVTANPSRGLRYSIVEFNAANPLGVVSLQFFSLNTSTTERLTAIHHKNGKDIWLLSTSKQSASSNATNLVAHKIDENGINENPVLSSIANINSNAGALKISPDGKKIALTTDDQFFYLLNFDAETGLASLIIEANLAFSFTASYISRGIAFSNDSEVMYMSASLRSSNDNGFGIFKVDLTKPIDPLQTPIFGGPIFFSNNYFAGDMQLALDEKIYIAVSNKEGNSINKINQLAIINDPNNKIINNNFKPNFMDLESGSSFQGMPNFIQSYFASRILTANKCYTDAFNFTATSYTSISNILWDFGDGTNLNGLDVNHTYSAPGNYTVKATLTINGSEISVFKNITAYPVPILQDNQYLEECDNDFDGKTIFNLNNIHSLISSTFNLETIDFFNSERDAINGTNSISNPVNFENSIPNQEIWARVTNTNQCSTITNFTLKLNSNQLGSINDFYTCETADAKGDFDVNTIINDAKSQLNLPTNISLKVYPTFTDAQTNTNEITGIFNSISTQVFIKGFDSNNSCAGITNTKLIVNLLPKIDVNPIYEICFNPFTKPPVTINLNTTYNTYLWENENGVTIGTNSSFTLTKIGKYTVTVSKFENGINCTNSKTFEVLNPSKPQFSFIDVDTENENNNKIDVQINGNSSYLYSLDNQNFVGSGNQHLFTNVTPGVVTVFVKDVNDCEEPIQIDVAVIGFKKFFSPNGDGENEVWTISGLNEQSFKSVNILIYNRFGTIVGNITNFNKNYWDGTYNSKPQNENTYWYTAELVDLNDKIIKKTGNFSLIRD